MCSTALSVKTKESKMIDLRSDTVTRPSPAMREVMAHAEVGDDVFGDDPSVNRLQEMLANMVGMEAGLFVPSGTQSNLIGLMTHCQRGDEYIVGQTAHTYRYEAGGAAVLGSIQPQPIDFEPDGTLALDKIAEFIKPDDAHFARTRLICLENTTNGMALPMSYLESAAEFARDRGLAIHLDGARVFNASVFHKVPVAQITQHFDSVSICLSKGLGAPVGSVLCGGRNFISRAHRWRKMLGGGMRQAGVLAAAGIFALDHNVERLAIDHDHAAILADGLRSISGVNSVRAQTNMVFFRHNRAGGEMEEFLLKRGILVRGTSPVRLVTHLDVHDVDLPRVLDALKEYFEGCP